MNLQPLKLPREAIRLELIVSWITGVQYNDVQQIIHLIKTRTFFLYC